MLFPLAGQALPQYNGWGSLEDSKQSCLSLVPQPPKKDFIRMLENDGKILRFAAVLVTMTTYPYHDLKLIIMLSKLTSAILY